VWPAIQRMLSILFGFGIAVLFQVLVFPVFARRQLTERLAAALEDSVSLIYESAVKAKDNVSSASLGGRIDDASGASRRKAGSKGKAAGRRTAALQREQRKKAAGLDSLLGPTAVVRLWVLWRSCKVQAAEVVWNWGQVPLLAATCCSWHLSPRNQVLLIPSIPSSHTGAEAAARNSHNLIPSAPCLLSSQLNQLSCFPLPLPLTQALKLLPGPLSAAAFGSLVDAAAAVGSTAVHLSAVLEAAHKNLAGTDYHPLPQHLEVRLLAGSVHLGRC